MISYKDELYHHGIKGQKWGVRRFQNEDGSLTFAGKRRVKKNAKLYHKVAAQNADTRKQLGNRVNALRDSIKALKNADMEKQAKAYGDGDTEGMTKARDLLIAKREAEARILESNIAGMDHYMTKLSKVDLSKYSKKEYRQEMDKLRQEGQRVAEKIGKIYLKDLDENFEKYKNAG